MPLSERAASQMFGHVGISREQARRLLRTGVAGVPTRVGATSVYDEQAVRELAASPCVNEAQLARLCPRGVFVARLGRARTLDLTLPWDEQAACAASQLALPVMTQLLLHVKLRVAGTLPWVATVSGLVVFGGETTGWGASPDGSLVFELREPGAWFESVRRRWFAFGRGRHWFFWDPCRLTQ